MLLFNAIKYTPSVNSLAQRSQCSSSQPSRRQSSPNKPCVRRPPRCSQRKPWPRRRQKLRLQSRSTSTSVRIGNHRLNFGQPFSWSLQVRSAVRAVVVGRVGDSDRAEATRRLSPRRFLNPEASPRLVPCLHSALPASASGCGRSAEPGRTYDVHHGRVHEVQVQMPEEADASVRARFPHAQQPSSQSSSMCWTQFMRTRSAR